MNVHFLIAIPYPAKRLKPLLRVLVWLLMLWSLPMHAATGVIGTGSPSTCTEAALDAQVATAPVGGTITFDCGGIATVSLTAEITITANTTFNGAGLISLDGGSATRLFVVNSGATLTLSHITLSDGAAGSDCNYSGGAVCVNTGGVLTATNTTFTGNYAPVAGGAIENNGTTALTDVSVVGNAGAANGGGIENDSGTLTLTNATVSNNVANGFEQQGFPVGSDVTGGGGLSNNAVATITNSTFTGNYTAYGEGAAIRSSATTTVRYSTIAFNVSGIAGGGILGSATFQASILASNNPGNCDVSGGATSQGYSFSDDVSCAFAATGDITNNLAKIGTPSYNGGPNIDATGPLLTFLPQSGSPAIDAIPSGTAGCGSTVTTDERGQTRPANGGLSATHCDMGAVEVQPTAAPTTGTVTVSKYLVGPEAASVPGTSPYSVTLTCGTKVLTPQNVVAGGTTTFANVPVGTCTLGEDATKLPVIAGVGWAAPVFIPSNTLTVYGGLVTNSTIGNSASAEGSVVITKVVAGPAAVAALVPTDIPYSITLICGTTNMGTQMVAVGEAATFLNAPAGSCTASESTPFAGADWVWAAPVFSPSATFTVAKAGTTKITLTNTANLPANSVLVNVVQNGTASADVGTFFAYSISLTCAGHAAMVMNAFVAQPAVFLNVPNGNCTLTETPPTSLGITFATPTFSPSATLTMTTGGTPSVTVTNTMNYIPDTVEVLVAVVGPAANSVPPSATFPVTLTCGSKILSANVTSAGIAFTSVPVGKCTLKQGTLPTVSGVVWGTPTYPSAAFPVPEPGRPEPVVIFIINTANTSALTTGSIIVNSGVAGTGQGSVPFDTGLTLVVVCGTNPPIRMTSALDGDVTFSGLPVGNCSLTQGALPNIPGIAWGAPEYFPGQTISVVTGGTSVATIINNAEADTIFADGFDG